MSNQSKKRNKKFRTFGFTSTLKAKIYDKANKKKHRNKPPVFMQNYQRKDYAYTTWFFLQRCETHDFNKNPYLNALRLANYERETIRRDRREVLTVLVPTLISYCDFSPTSSYLFEVRASVEHIAKMCNQAYESWDNKAGKRRVRCDTVRGALEMLEAAELITVLREYDKQGRKHKAMRIWLNVEFFLMFGITEKQLRKLVVDFHKYQFVNNRLDKTFKEYEKHLAKLEHKEVADINKQHSLRNLLIKRRKDFLGEHIIQFVSQRKPSNYLTLDIESDVFKPCFRSFADCNSPEEVHKLQKRLWDKERIRERARLKAANDIAYRKAQMQGYLNDLRFA
ncbi:RepA family replication protein [Rodentibacter caecimuris]|uniref:RepA family replication protein n=1 Tax=Rodentibacter caecimuris TaxID=1796644 RepID=UPI00211A346D|nr:RepA family replication protein [Rodentibacter heylii]